MRNSRLAISSRDILISSSIALMTAWSEFCLESSLPLIILRDGAVTGGATAAEAAKLDERRAASTP